MAKKDEKPATLVHAAAKPVIAIEYGGQLYPSFQKAEGARAHADLMTLIAPPRDMNHYSMHDAAHDFGKREAVEAIINDAERVHGILSRYLDAAKVEMPSEVR